MAHKHSLTCPSCNTEIHGATEQELVENFQEHAHSKHGKEMSDEKVREMMDKEHAR